MAYKLAAPRQKPDDALDLVGVGRELGRKNVSEHGV
jgi:hypothetical protein